MAALGSTDSRCLSSVSFPCSLFPRLTKFTRNKSTPIWLLHRTKSKESWPRSTRRSPSAKKISKLFSLTTLGRSLTGKQFRQQQQQQKKKPQQGKATEQNKITTAKFHLINILSSVDWGLAFIRS